MVELNGLILSFRPQKQLRHKNVWHIQVVTFVNQVFVKYYPDLLHKIAFVHRTEYFSRPLDLLGKFTIFAYVFAYKTLVSLNIC